jgi:hypothetical protein
MDYECFMKKLLFVFPILLLIISGVLFYYQPSSEFIWFLVVLINLNYMLRFYRCVPLFVLFSFFLMYSFELYNYFVNNLEISYWMDFNTAYYLNKTSILTGIFFTIFGSIVFNVNQKNMVDMFSIVESSRFVFYLSVVLFFLCAYFGMQGETILSAGYGSSEIQKTPLFEYAIVFFVLAVFFSGKIRGRLFIFWIMLFYFSLKVALYGGRVEAIQIILVLMYFQTNFFRNWKLRTLYLSILIAFITLLVVGRIRSDPYQFFIILENPLSLINFAPISKAGVVSSNYGDVQQASARMIGLVDTNVWDLEFRFKSFISYLFNIFLYGTDFKANANLALIDQKTYGAGGGGLIVAQFYVWMGWLGTVVSATFLGVIIREGLKAGVNKYLFIYTFMLLITFPRWYAYGPLAFVKMCLITTLLYIFFLKLSVFLKRTMRVFDQQY